MAEKTASQAQHSADTTATTASTTGTTTGTTTGAASAKAPEAAFPFPFASFAPAFTAAMPGFEQATAWYRKAAEEQAARVAGVQADYARLEKKHVEQLTSAVDEMARLTKASFGWYATLAEQGRQMGLESVRRSASLFTPAV